jgi:membrane protease subunit HflK
VKRHLVTAGVVTVAALAYAASGWVAVAPGEVAVVRRLGRVVTPPWGPGLHLGAPRGIDRVVPIRTDEVRRLIVGLATTPGAQDDPGAGEFLTGDLNLLRAEATVQYRVDDPIAFTLRSGDVEPILQRLGEASLSRALARQGVDATLRDGRAEAARQASAALERGARQYGLGIAVLGVSLTDARPPTEVASDFAAAQSARSDRDRRVNEAKTYAAKSATESKAVAEARIVRARGRAERTVTLARSRAGRFLALLAETGKNRSQTVRRLYLEALRELWAHVGRKLVLTPDEPVDLSIVK